MIHRESELPRQEFGLIEPSLSRSRPVQWHRKREFRLKPFTRQARPEGPSQGLRQRDPCRILQVMNDAAHRIVEEKQRSCEVEGVISAPAGAAPRLDSRRRHTALNTERPRNSFKF